MRSKEIGHVVMGSPVQLKCPQLAFPYRMLNGPTERTVQDLRNHVIVATLQRCRAKNSLESGNSSDI